MNDKMIEISKLIERQREADGNFHEFSNGIKGIKMIMSKRRMCLTSWERDDDVLDCVSER